MNKIEIPQSVVDTAIIQSEIPYNYEDSVTLNHFLNIHINTYLEDKARESKSCWWWEASQNNSGGYFIDNEDVCETLLIQAESEEEAEERLNYITKDYSEYCGCCGERWYGVSEGFVSVEEYKKDYYRSPFRNKVMIYPKYGKHYIVHLGRK